MSLFTPGRRWQPPFFPFKKEPAGKRILRKIERWIKGPMFGCRMCGNCLLQETAFICPMECPKGMRNGPCGGSSADKCYVDETRPCIWYKIHERAFKMGREELLLEVLPPLDWDKVGTETWGDVVRQMRKFGTGRFVRSLLSIDKALKAFAWEGVFRPVRQPEWWNGDSLYHAPGYDERKECLSYAHRSGFQTSVSVEPMLDSANIDILIGELSPYVTHSIWIGKMNHLGRFGKGSDKVLQQAIKEIKRGQTDSIIKSIYGRHKDNPMIRWKKLNSMVMPI